MLHTLLPASLSAPRRALACRRASRVTPPRAAQADGEALDPLLLARSLAEVASERVSALTPERLSEDVKALLGPGPPSLEGLLGTLTRGDAELRYSLGMMQEEALARARESRAATARPAAASPEPLAAVTTAEVDGADEGMPEKQLAAAIASLREDMTAARASLRGV